MKNAFAPAWVRSGRILLALMFIVSGLAKLASTHVQTTGYVVSDGFPLDTVPAWVMGTFEVVCGLCLAAGYRLRLVAPIAAVFVLGTSFAFHAFWAVEPEYQFAQQLLFMKNLSLVGGLLLVAGAAGATGRAQTD
ncbi:MAG: DoxX family protein [Rhodoferax sp.]|nr:DoxX family protein [Rhodoferax sp.]